MAIVRMRFDRTFNERRASVLGAVLNISPYFQVYYPGGEGGGSAPSAATGNSISVAPSNVQIVALKKAEREESVMVRLQEIGGKRTNASLRIRGARAPIRAKMEAFELATLRVVRKRGKRFEARKVNLVEEL